MDTSKNYYFFVDDDEKLSREVQEYLVSMGYSWGDNETYLPSYGFINTNVKSDGKLRLERWSSRKEYTRDLCMDWIENLKRRDYIEMDINSLLAPQELFEM